MTSNPTNKDTNQKIDEIAQKLRYPHYYVDYHAGKTQTELNVEIEAVVQEAREQIQKLLVEERIGEIQKLLNAGYIDADYIEIVEIAKKAYEAQLQTNTQNKEEE